MTSRKVAAYAVEQVIPVESAGRWVFVGACRETTAVLADKKHLAYPDDRGMPSAEALRSYGVKDTSDIEIVESM